jgi:hypothetical protein
MGAAIHVVAVGITERTCFLRITKIVHPAFVSHETLQEDPIAATEFVSVFLGLSVGHSLSQRGDLRDLGVELACFFADKDRSKAGHFSKASHGRVWEASVSQGYGLHPKNSFR